LDVEAKAVLHEKDTISRNEQLQRCTVIAATDRARRSNSDEVIMAKTTSRSCQSKYVKHRYTKKGHTAAAAKRTAVRKGTMWSKRPGYITELI
jgi:hypothetical protein